MEKLTIFKPKKAYTVKCNVNNTKGNLQGSRKARTGRYLLYVLHKDMKRRQ